MGRREAILHTWWDAVLRRRKGEEEQEFHRLAAVVVDTRARPVPTLQAHFRSPSPKKSKIQLAVRMYHRPCTTTNFLDTIITIIHTTR